MLLASSLSVTLALSLAAAPTAAPTGRTEITWWGHAAFTVKTPKGTVLAIDPWLSNPKGVADAAKRVDKVDFILVTHGHADHVGDSIDLAKRTGAKFVGTGDMAQALLGAGYPMDPATMRNTSGNMGGTFGLTDEVSVTLVPAVHSSGFKKDEQSPPQYAGNPVGFVIQVKGGPTIYHTGDTDLAAEMQFVGERWPVDVMLACIGGHFTMDPEGAARAAALVKAKTIIPMHFGTFALLRGTPDELQRALARTKSKVRVAVLQPGETKAF